MKKKWLLILFIITCYSLMAEELVILNRTGFNILDIRIQKARDLRPGENLIPYDVLMDQGFIQLELEENGAFVVLLTDEMGDIYRKEIDSFPGTPKILISLDDLQIMDMQSNQLRVGISNQVNLPITELYITPAHTESWGSDVLEGSPLRQGESVQILIESSGNGLFDLKFTCDEGTRLKDYYLKSVELRDLGLFTLRFE